MVYLALCLETSAREAKRLAKNERFVTPWFEWQQVKGAKGGHPSYWGVHSLSVQHILLVVNTGQGNLAQYG